jgi:hypothetical protein
LPGRRYSGFQALDKELFVYPSILSTGFQGLNKTPEKPYYPCELRFSHSRSNFSYLSDLKGVVS